MNCVFHVYAFVTKRVVAIAASFATNVAQRIPRTLPVLRPRPRKEGCQQHPRKERIILFMASFVICNANGLHNTTNFPDKPRRFFQHLLNSSADFAFVSETHFTSDDDPWALIPHAVFASYHSNSAGVHSYPSALVSASPTSLQMWMAGG